MQHIKNNLSLIVLCVLLLANIFVWYAIFSEGRDGVLTVAFLDVGQGDAIFIEAPNGNQILVDGGPNKSVLRQLSEVMPFYDRSIDIVVATHPDKDHIGGLPAVLSKFKVNVFLEPGVESDNGTYEALLGTADRKGVKKMLAKRGERVFLDKDVYIDILSPDRDTYGWETNMASVVLRLVYGDTSFLLTGDVPQAMEEYLVSFDGERLASDILKLGHHGSRTSTSKVFLSAVSPQYAIISAGLNNRYGHPHKEVVDMLKKLDIPSLATYKSGTIIIESDGENIKLK